MRNQVLVAVFFIAAKNLLADKNCVKPTFDKNYQKEYSFFDSVESKNKRERVDEKSCLRTHVSAQFVQFF